MLGRSRGRTVLGADSGSGWLLAELSLILMIVMIGSELPLSTASPSLFPTASASPSSTKQPKPQDKKTPPGLANEPRLLHATLANGPRRAAKSVARQIKTAGITPGLVLLWGVGTQVTGPDQSAKVKAKLAPLLKKYSSPIRAYYKGPSSRYRQGTIYAEVFYLNE